MSEMTEYTFDGDIVSDLHKDAYGVRPGSAFWEIWTLSTDSQKQTIWDNLMDSLSYEIKAEDARKSAAILTTEAAIAAAMSLVKDSTREDAIRWMHDAEGTFGDIGHLEYRLGVPYGYLSGVRPGFKAVA